MGDFLKADPEETPRVLLEIKEKYFSLNPALQKIADYFLTNPWEALDSNISKIAEKSGVSVSTVSRFVKEMNYENFKSLKLHMANSLGSNKKVENDEVKEVIYGSITPEDDPSEICRKVILNNIRTLQDTLGSINDNEINNLAQNIVNSEKIYLYAAGRSTVAAMSLEKRLYQIGINIISHFGSHEQAVSSSLIKPGELVLGISNSGRSRAIVNNIKRARKMGGITYGITSYEASPLAQEAEHVINTTSNYPGIFEIEPSTETLSQLVIVDCIFMNVIVEKYDEAKRDIKISAEAFEEEKIPANNNS